MIKDFIKEKKNPITGWDDVRPESDWMVQKTQRKINKRIKRNAEQYGK